MFIENLSLLIYPLAHAGAAFAFAVLFTIPYKNRVWAILQKDRLGWGILGASVLMVGCGLWIAASQPFWGAWLQTVGGLLLGVSVLIVLPDPMTQSLVDWRNIGIVLGLAGAGAALYGLFLIFYPLVDVFQSAWEALKANFEWRYLYFLIAGPLAAGLGYVIKAFRSQEREGQKPLKKDTQSINERITHP